MPTAQMEIFVSLVASVPKDVLRLVIMDTGGQFAMMGGVATRLEWFAPSWDSQEMVNHRHMSFCVWCA